MTIDKTCENVFLCHNVNDIVLHKFCDKDVIYSKVPKFSDARKLCCYLPNTQTKRPNLRIFCQKDANGIANSEDPDQMAPPLGAV